MIYKRLTYDRVIIALFVLLYIGSFEYTIQAQNVDDGPVLERVKPEFACMINDKLFEEKQIPVPIGDKTYYGCCQMCVKTLNENPDSRFTIDPVSRDTVDKTLAVLGADSEGHVFYFESEANLKTFDPAVHGADSTDGQEE